MVFNRDFYLCRDALPRKTCALCDLDTCAELREVCRLDQSITDSRLIDMVKILPLWYRWRVIITPSISFSLGKEFSNFTWSDGREHQRT